MTERRRGTPAPPGAVLVAVCRERADGERRVALTPDETTRLAAKGARVRIERGAGTAAGFPDESYALAGAGKLAADAATALAAADVVLRVAPPSDDEIAMLPTGALVISYLRPLDSPEISKALAGARRQRHRGRTGTAHHPRADDGRALVAGEHRRLSALVAATLLPRYFPLLMTAAGTVPPVKVLVLGAGVAGLQAIATAQRLGAP